MQTLIAHEYMDKFTGRDKLYKALDKMTGDVDMTCNTEEFAQILAKRYVQKNESTICKLSKKKQDSLINWPLFTS